MKMAKMITIKPITPSMILDVVLEDDDASQVDTVTAIDCLIIYYSYGTQINKKDDRIKKSLQILSVNEVDTVTARDCFDHILDFIIDGFI